MQWQIWCVYGRRRVSDLTVLLGLPFLYRIPFDILISLFFLDLFHPCPESFISALWVLLMRNGLLQLQPAPPQSCTHHCRSLLRKRSLLPNSSVHAVLPVGGGGVGKVILIISTPSNLFPPSTTVYCNLPSRRLDLCKFSFFFGNMPRTALSRFSSDCGESVWGKFTSLHLCFQRAS